MAAVQVELAEADVDGAGAELDRATTAIRRATAHLTGPHWDLAARTPLASRWVAVIWGVTDVARSAVMTAEEVVAASATLLGPAGELQVSRRPDGSIDLDRLTRVASFVSGLPTDELRASRDRLAATPTAWLPSELAAGRRDALAQADGAIAMIERADAAVDMLPAFLGRDESRRYLLALQNPAELRGTGGVIGYFAVLTADDGKLTITQPERYVVLTDDERTPVPAPDEFVRRYGINNAASFFGNVNLDPHLPMVAPVMLRIYEARRGDRLDGVVMLDPLATEQILGAIGPVDVPDEVVDPEGRIPDPVPADRVAEVTMVDAYDVFGGVEPERQDYHSAFAEAAFATLLTEWDPFAVGERVGQAAQRRNLQLYSVHAEEQAAFETLGIDGGMPGASDRDVLAVTANNAGGNKMDVHVAHRVEGHVTLELDDRYSTGARRTLSLEVELENPLGTTGHDIYIIGNRLLGPKEGEQPRFEGPLGLNRTWFTVWSDQRSKLSRAVDETGADAVFDSDVIHEHLAVDHFLEVPAESTRSFSIELDGAVPVRRDGGDLVYDLTIWRQAKAIPDHWDLTISPPEGWAVAEVSMAGGGDGQGMGVAGGGEPVSAARTPDGRVRLRGAVTEDVQLSLRFTTSTWQRLLGSLGGEG